MALTRPKITQLSSSITEFNDPLIEINADLTGANTNDLGIIINRGSSGNNVGIIWDRSAAEFVLVQTTADGNSTGDLSFSAYANLQLANLVADSVSTDTLLSVTGEMKFAITSITADATLDATHRVAVVKPTTVDITLTLPTAASCIGRVYTIKHGNDVAQNVIIDGNGAETVDGNATLTLTPRQQTTIISDGTEWHVIA